MQFWMVSKKHAPVNAQYVQFLLRTLKFVAGEPLDFAGLRRGGLAEGVAEARYLGVAREIPGFDKGVGGLVVVVLDVIFGLRFAPSQVVAFEFQAFADGKSRDADAAKAEMVGTVVVARFRMRVGLDCQLEIFGDLFDFWIKRSAFRTADFHFFGNTDGRERIVIQIDNRLYG